MGLALHDYASTNNNYFPTGGEGTDFVLFPKGPSQFDVHSTFTMLLPFIERNDLYSQMNLNARYNATAAQPDPTTGQFQVPGADGLLPAQHVVKTYICPSNPLIAAGMDNEGFGTVDYGATCYTDIDPATGFRNKSTRTNGALHVAISNGVLIPLKGSLVTDISDGTSNTIAIAEDVGRTDAYLSPYTDPVTGNLRQFQRWAEPDSAFGVSGYQAGGNFNATNGTGTPAYDSGRAINNTPTPFGGSANTCIWALKNNCGNDDEIYSFHGDGAFAVFCDGHVQWMNANINRVVVRYLVTPNGNEPIQDPNF
jgi:prepilin-type processing-associated H-X9-DG protein